MILKYGTYSHATNEATIQIAKEPVYSARGYRLGTLERWNVQGVLHADDAAALTTALDALEDAYQTQGKDLVLQTDASVDTQHKIATADTVGGVKVMHFGYPTGDGAEYTTYRTYEIELEALRNDGETVLYLEYEESFQTIGTGGPRRILVELLTEPPVEQTINNYTIIRVIQQGRAVGLAGHPPIPSPIYPGAVGSHDNMVSVETPRMTNRSSQREYPISWAYQMELASAPLPYVYLPTAF